MGHIEVADLNPVFHGTLILINSLICNGSAHLNKDSRNLEYLSDEELGRLPFILDVLDPFNKVKAFLLNDLERHMLSSSSLSDRRKLSNQKCLLPIVCSQ